MKSLRLILSNRRYFGPALVFTTLNVVIGTWAIYIPNIKSKLGINEGQLGLAILCMALGTLTMIVLAPKLIGYFGVGKATAYSLFIFLFTFILPFSTGQYSWLCVGMYIVGAFSGFTDVAMNTLVAEIEKKDKVHIMSANHGFFSLGGFIGAGVGGFFLSDTIKPLNHLWVVIAVLLLLNLLLVSSYFGVDTEARDKDHFKIKNFKPLVVLACIAFFIMASEGAIVDWSALYLEKVSLAKLSWIGLGFTVFSGAMAFGRFLGDEISRSVGSKILILGGSLLAILGFVFILLIDPVVAIVGFGLVGLGLSVIIPELFRMSGQVPDVPSAQAISFISGVGFFGFLLGPVLLGFLAELSSLHLSYLVLLGFVLVSFLLAIKLNNKNKEGAK